MAHLAALVLALSAAWIVASLAALVVSTRRGAPSGARPLPVTVLKPLAGADPDLERNLESFFIQDHPAFEILFGVEDARDPAVAIVERLLRRHPHVRARLVVHEVRDGYNPKVRNLRGMWPHAAHDWVLVSDSNIRVAPHALRELATLAAEPGVGIVTNVIVGAGERSVAGALEAVQLCGFVAGGAALPTLCGDALVVGKSMLLSRRILASLGGLDRVADVLAEDHVLGKTFQHAGYAVRIAPTPVVNVIGAPSLRAVFDRQVRWALMRFRLRPLAHLAEIFVCPLALASAAALVLPAPSALAIGLVLAWVRDVGGWLVLRGARASYVPLLLSPVRDVLALVVWVVAPLRRHVAWRGHRVRVGAGTLLYGAPSATSRGARAAVAAPLAHVTSSSRRAPRARARIGRAAA